MAEEEALTEQTSPYPASASPSARDVIDVDLWLLLHTPPGFNDRGMDLQRDAPELPTIESNAEPTESSESSSRSAVPIAMSSKDCKTNVIEPRGDMSRGLDTAVRIGPSETTLKELNPSIAKNKRSLKRFNCKTTKCLKPAYCLETCTCIDCFNKLVHEDILVATRKQNESWNPLAFASKISRSSVPETVSLKRCNCQKTKCLKLCCECFAAGAYCLETCSCIDCSNKVVHEDLVRATSRQIHSRDPLAFVPKVIRSSDSVPETGDDASITKTPASVRYKRGCNCVKSKCLKK